MNTQERDADRFTAIFDRCARRVYAYARRHSDAHTAEDVVAETFLVAWRRLRDVPADDPLPWLLVVARNTLTNHRRSTARRDRLTTQLSALDRLAEPHPGVEATVVDRSATLDALGGLTELEREAVLLIAWDGLSTTSAAQVAGCSARSFAVRLHRARKRLRRLLEAGEMDTEPLTLLEELS